MATPRPRRQDVERTDQDVIMVSRSAVRTSPSFNREIRDALVLHESVGGIERFYAKHLV